MRQQIPFCEIFSVSLQRDGIPLYRQIYTQIKELILSGKLLAKTKLPASRDLATRLEVSRNTVVTAYEQLWAEGFVEGEIGSGTYVANVDVQHTLSSTTKISLQQRPLLSKRGHKIYDLAKKDFSTLPIPFAPGIPDIALFPKSEWGRMLSRTCRMYMNKVFAYDDAAGFGPLRQAICKYLNGCRGVKCTPEQVIITCGAQQGLELITRFLIDPGEGVAMENPGYVGARNAFYSAEAHLIPIALDQQGIRIDLLESYDNVRLVYLTPSHQYPTGISMPLSRRIEVLKWAENNNAWVIEDDYDSEYRYSGQPIAAMQGMDTSNRVLYLGTFSKVLFPGLRLGYLVVPAALVPTFTVAKSIADRNSPSLLQSVLADFIDSGQFTSHLRKTRIIYKKRQEYFIRIFQQRLGEYFSLEPSSTGMHLVAICKKNWNDQHLAGLARQSELQLRPLSSYYLVPDAAVNGLVLGYAGFSELQIAEGLERLRELCCRFVNDLAQ